MNVVKALPALVTPRRRSAASPPRSRRSSHADRMGGAVTRLGWDLARGRRPRPAPVRALVTGAAGFIGAHVVAALAAAGARCGRTTAASRRPCPPAPTSCAGDVLDRDALRRALDGVDAVFHLAALYSYAPATPWRWSGSTSRARAR